jgi:hypothetical protein
MLLRNIGYFRVVCGHDDPIKQSGLLQDANRVTDHRTAEKRLNILARDTFAAASGGYYCNDFHSAFGSSCGKGQFCTGR